MMNPRKFSIGNLFKRVVSFYKTTAIIFVNMVVLFVLINQLCVFIPNKKHDSPLEFVQLSLDGKPLDLVYPGFDRKDLDQLLRESWTRTYQFEPYSLFRVRPFTGRYVNVSDGGFRMSKNQAPWPPSTDHYNVFVFGGSNVFGIGVSDEQTMVSCLQEELATLKDGHKNIRVYNFGRGNYYSTQERILFSRLLIEGFVPDLALFFDGALDFNHPDDRPALSHHFELLFDQLKPNMSIPTHWILIKSWLAGLPSVKILRNFIKHLVNSQTEHQINQTTVSDQASNAVIVEHVMNRYEKNKKAIDALAEAFHVRTVYAWLPCPLYNYDLSHHLFNDLLMKSGDKMFAKGGYPCMKKRMEDNKLGDNFLWCADIQENVKVPLYIDTVHYTAGMHKLIAKEIASQMKTRNLLFR